MSVLRHSLVRNVKTARSDSSLGGNLEEALHKFNLSANVAFPDPFNLSLPNHVHCLEPADGPPRRLETEEAESGIDATFDAGKDNVRDSQRPSFRHLNHIYLKQVFQHRPYCLISLQHEPVHSHLLAMLESYPFQSKIVADRAATLAVALEKYRGHQWIDAPTHMDFTADSPYDVYELDSLDNFQQDVRETLARRVAARVVRSIGRLKEDGTRAPVLLVFDEVWKIRDRYPHILAVIKRGARQGRKENVVTMLATQAYEDFEELYDITRTAGIKLIGKQIGDSRQLIADAGLSDAAAAAISAIRNVRGEYAQYVLTLGSGFDQVVEMIQMDLSPAELWTFATNPDERNARARVQSLTGWPLTDVIRWLAAVYPRGLTAAGVTEIDESLLSLQCPLE